MSTQVRERRRVHLTAADGPRILAKAGLTLSLVEAAAVLGIGETRAYQQAKAGTFPVKPLMAGGRYRFSTAEIRKLLGLPAVDPSATARAEAS